MANVILTLVAISLAIVAVLVTSLGILLLALDSILLKRQQSKFYASQSEHSDSLDIH